MSGLKCHQEVANETDRVAPVDPKIRFEEAYGVVAVRQIESIRGGFDIGEGACFRISRRYVNRYEEKSTEGLLDWRLTQASFCCAPVDKVTAITERYLSRHRGWNVKCGSELR